MEVSGDQSQKKDEKKDEKNKEKDKEKNPASKKPASKNLWRAALVGNVLVSLLGIALLYLALVARNYAGRFMEFIDGYDGGEFFLVIAVLGFVSILVGAYGSVVAYLSLDKKKFNRIRYLVLAYIGWGVGSVILLVVSFWLTYSAIDTLDVVFKPGFTASLVKYVKEKKIRASIDTLQRDMECCGSYNHTEWFTVSWSENISKTETSIPQSCCDSKAVAAKKIKCVQSAPLGETTKLTVYTKGCVPALVRYYGGALNLRGIVMVGIAFIEAAVSIFVVIQVKRHGKESPDIRKKEMKQLLIAKAEVHAKKKAEMDKAMGLNPPWATAAGYGAVPVADKPPQIFR